ncbi:porin [Psychrobacter fulvigenes]|uniref:porin n=1 Tax=Psychrobacter fulvigenes TaxID=533323 RepID=UPI001919F229|nr:porin [Psychrobacter fulvigenes]
MKKLLLATAVAALSVSAAQAAPTVYGKAFVAVDYEDIDKNIGEDEDSLQINSHASRIGFKGSEAMTANTDVIYQLEYGIDIDGGGDKTFKSRDTYLGLNNNTFGEFRFGRNQSSLDRINNAITADGGYWDNLGDDNNMVDSGRIDNSMIWTAPKYQDLPLEFSAMYAASEDNDSDGWGAALMFDQGTGFTAGVAYDKDLNIGNGAYNNTTGDIIRGTATVDLSKFTTVPVTLGALYQQADFDVAGSKKEKGYILSAAMGLQNFAKPATVYAQYNNTSNLRGSDGLDSDQIVVGGKYFYQPNMIMHAYAGWNDSDAEVTKLDDAKVYTAGSTETFAIGTALEYKF